MKMNNGCKQHRIPTKKKLLKSGAPNFGYKMGKHGKQVIADVLFDDEMFWYDVEDEYGNLIPDIYGNKQAFDEFYQEEIYDKIKSIIEDCADELYEATDMKCEFEEVFRHRYNTFDFSHGALFGIELEHSYNDGGMMVNFYINSYYDDAIKDEDFDWFAQVCDVGFKGKGFDYWELVYDYTFDDELVEEYFGDYDNLFGNLVNDYNDLKRQGLNIIKKYIQKLYNIGGEVRYVDKTIGNSVRKLNMRFNNSTNRIIKNYRKNGGK